MKKHALILSVLVLSLILTGFLGFNVHSVNASSCVPGDLYDSNTGKPCPVLENPKNNSAVSTLFKRELTVGSKGEDVKALQKVLKDSGFLSGKVDGSYGPITKNAVKKYQKENSISVTGKVDLDTIEKIKILPWYKLCPLIKDSSEGFDAICPSIPEDPQSPVISGVSGPQTLNVNQQGTWTVKASSPSGGDLSYSVFWGDENTYSSYGTTDSSESPLVQSATFSHVYSRAGVYNPTFTVTSENTIRCIKAPCPGNGGSAQTSLSVNVGDVATAVGNLSISPASISITMENSNTPIKAYYQPPMPPCPSGAMCKQMMPAIIEVNAKWSVSNPNIAEVRYIGGACEGCKSYPVIQGISVGTTELKATFTPKLGDTLIATAQVIVKAAPSSFGVLSPNGGETWEIGSIQTIKWKGVDVSLPPECGKNGLFCTSPAAPASYDIKLVSYSSPCPPTGSCPLIFYPDLVIAKGVSGSSYDWSVGIIYNTEKPNLVSEGLYKILICKTNSSICDSSDSYFKIVNKSSKNSEPQIITTSTSIGNIQPGQSVGFSWSAVDSDNDDLSWSVNWGDNINENGLCNATRRNTGSGWNYSTKHTWAKAGTYQVEVSVSDCVGGVDSYSFTVRVLEPIAIP